MSGFTLAIGVSIILSLISVGGIKLSRRVNGMASINIVQSFILIKLMMGISLSIAVLGLTNVNQLVYSLTLGIYACSILPILTYYLVKQDCTISKRIKNIK